MKKSVLSVIVAFVIAAAALVSCVGGKGGSNDDGVEVMAFDKVERLSYEDLPEGFYSGLEYVILLPESQEEMFAEADKLIYRNGKIYLMDWVNRKLLSFNKDGRTELVLHKRGRGPGEYLQISDFDVDDSGNILVLDGQKDELMKYSASGEFLESFHLPFQADFVCSPAENLYYFGIAAWDESPYKDNKVLVTDGSFNALAAFHEYDGLDDINYSFPAAGFVRTEKGVLFHSPIDADICLIEGSSLGKIYRCDFGSKAVPDEVRADIERHRDEFSKYETLVNSVYVGKGLVAGTLLCGLETRDFLLDRKSGRMYMQDNDTKFINVSGISDETVVFRLLAQDSPLPEQVPAHVRQALADGRDVLAIIDAGKIFK